MQFFFSGFTTYSIIDRSKRLKQMDDHVGHPHVKTPLLMLQTLQTKLA